MSEVRVFISANLEWDCSSLSLHAPLLRTGGREKNYIYIFRREKRNIEIFTTMKSNSLFSTIHCSNLTTIFARKDTQTHLSFCLTQIRAE